MISSKSKRYWRRMFEGENGDIVKNILTDGRWKPSPPHTNEYNPDWVCCKDDEAPLVFKIVLTVFLVILAGAVMFGVGKFLMWI